MHLTGANMYRMKPKTALISTIVLLASLAVTVVGLTVFGIIYL